MSVLMETSLGDIVFDLFVDQCPIACLNFIKLCKIKYYNNCLFHNIQKEFIAQSGDAENQGGSGGNSIYGIVNGLDARYFKDEIRPQYRFNQKGLLATANLGPDQNTSTFFITLSDNNIDYLNDKHTIFGRIEEGLEVLDKMNRVYVDRDNRPYQNIRIKHTIILEDPFDDIEGMFVPSESPAILRDTLEYNRLEADVNVDTIFKDEETEAKIKAKMQEQEARNHALVLEMLEDLPDADVNPPENVLFICKLNPVTQDDDLELIFSRFGSIKSCQIIRDKSTKRSLKYAFIEFEKVESCEKAYFAMNNVVIDDRRIKVDFSQSVAKNWQMIKRGIQPQVMNLDGEEQEISVQNSNKKYEIVANKNFTNKNNSYGLIFNDKKQNETKNNEQTSYKHKSSEQKYNPTNKHDKHKRSRSNDRNKTKDKYYDKDYDKDRDHDNKRKNKRHYRSRSRSDSRSDKHKPHKSSKYNKR